MASKLDQYMKEQGLAADAGDDSGFAPMTVTKARDAVIGESHPEMGVERFVVMNFATNPETAKRYLESDRGGGWEVQHHGGWDFSVRKPGEDQWHQLDPSGFDAGDILDIGGDVATGIAAGVGTGAGAVGGAPTGPGALATAAAGGAAGGGLAEFLKVAIGKHLGLDPTLGEAATGIGAEAALGAAAPFIGKAAGAAFNKVFPGGTARQLLEMGDEGLEAAARTARGGGPKILRGADEITRGAAGGAPVAREFGRRAAPIADELSPFLNPSEEIARGFGGGRPALAARRAAAPPAASPARPAAPDLPTRPMTETELVESIWGRSGKEIPSREFQGAAEVLEAFGLAGAPGGAGKSAGRIAPLTGKRLHPGRAKAIADVAGAREAILRGISRGETTEGVGDIVRRLIKTRGPARGAAEKTAAGVGAQADRLRGLGATLSGGGPRTATTGGVGEAVEALGRVTGESVLEPERKIPKALTEAARSDLVKEVLGQQPLSRASALAKKMAEAKITGKEVKGGLASAGASLALGALNPALGAGYGAMNPKGLGLAMKALGKGAGWAGRAILRNQEPMKRIARARATPGWLKTQINGALKFMQQGDTEKFKAALYTLLSRPAFRKAMERETKGKVNERNTSSP